MPVTRVTVAEKQPAPEIVREIVQIPALTEAGEPIPGKCLERLRIRGSTEYASAHLPDGAVADVVLRVDGKAVATLGPWVANSRPGGNALVQVRLCVTDSAADPVVHAEPEP